MGQGKKYERNDEHKKLVEALSGYGIPHKDIARHIKIDYKTLLKYYRSELDEGITKADAAVMQNLHRMASKGNNAACAIFWAKCRMGWKEVDRTELTGKDGADLVPVIKININK